MLRHGVIAAGVEQHLPALWRAAGDALRHAASAAPCAASTRADAPGGSDASTSSTGAGSLATPAHRTPWRAWQRRRDAAQWRGFASGAGGSGSSDGVSLDDSAVQRLLQLQQQAGPGKEVVLRIEVEGGGCSGFQYKFRLDSNVGPDDKVFERGGARLVTDAVSLEFLKGAVIEFEDSLMRSAFQVAQNPNSESTCGCGSSFVAKM